MNKRPISPTFSEATTHASQLHGLDGKLITRADLRTSLQTYEQLLSTSASYRTALLNLSEATASFAEAIQGCANLKGCSFLTAKLQGASSGFHHLLANHLHVLSDAVDRKFERTLKYKIMEYKATVAERSETYERALREKSKIIRETEERNMRMGRRKERDMASFRSALAILQAQVDEIDRLKLEHYNEVEQHEEEFSDMVHGKIALVVRSTFEVFDRVTAKSTDPVLEPMLQSIPDPFESYGEAKAEGEIFSVLRPLGILSEASIPSTPREVENPSSGPPWAGAVSDDTTAQEVAMQVPSYEQLPTSIERDASESKTVSPTSESENRGDSVTHLNDESVSNHGAAKWTADVAPGMDEGGWPTLDGSGPSTSGQNTIKSRWRMRMSKAA